MKTEKQLFKIIYVCFVLFCCTASIDNQKLLSWKPDVNSFRLFSINFILVLFSVQRIVNVSHILIFKHIIYVKYINSRYTCYSLIAFFIVVILDLNMFGNQHLVIAIDFKFSNDKSSLVFFYTQKVSATNKIQYIKHVTSTASSKSLYSFVQLTQWRKNINT